MRKLLQLSYFPIFFVGGMGSIVWIIGENLPISWAGLVMATAIALSFICERVLPWQPSWNNSQKDGLRDVLHVVVNTSLTHSSLLLLPLLAAMAPLSSLWPERWPFWGQVLMTILILDFGIAAVHHQSHRWNWLWQFHAVHHSVTRMYGFNGLMKHPVHQCVETAIGIAPLWIMGIPADVAQALTFCVALQLLLQHSNVDYRTGPIKYLLANAEVHRFHHLRPPANGDINFGLFTTVYDHVAGTFFYDAKTAPRDSEAIGLSDQFPQRYDHQIAHPFLHIFEKAKRSKH